MAGTYGLAQPHGILSLLSEPAVSVTSDGAFANRTGCLELEQLQETDLSRGKSYVKGVSSVAPWRPNHPAQFDNGRILTKDAHAQSSILPALCHVDLFRVPDAFGRQNTFVRTSSAHNPTPSGVAHTSPRSKLYPVQNKSTLSSPESLVVQGSTQVVKSVRVWPDADVIAWFGSFPIRESSKCTDMLSGATFTQAESGEHRGRPATMFIFSDLAVHIEGTFVLRYRVAEMGVQYTQPRLFSAVAECYGEPFKISSASGYPSARASTRVAQHLALHGISVNALQDEPHGRERPGMDGSSATRTVSAPMQSTRPSTAPLHIARISARL